MKPLLTTALLFLSLTAFEARAQSPAFTSETLIYKKIGDRELKLLIESRLTGRRPINVPRWFSSLEAAGSGEVPASSRVRASISRPAVW